MSTDAVTPLRHPHDRDNETRGSSVRARRGATFTAASGLLRFLNRSPDTATTGGYPALPVALGRGRREHLQSQPHYDRAAFLFRVTLRRRILRARSITSVSAEDTAGDEPDRDAAVAGRRSNLKVRTLLSLGVWLRPARRRGGQAERSSISTVRRRSFGSSSPKACLAKAGGRKSLPSRRRGTAMSCCAGDARSVAPRVEGAPIALRYRDPVANAGCFPATGAASRSPPAS